MGLAPAAAAELELLGEAVPLLQELIRIPSVNPEQVDDPEGADAEICGEKRLATFLAAKCEAAGADEVLVDDSDTAPGRTNLYAIWRAPGGDSGRWCGIDDHLDTVAVKGMAPFPAFSGELTPDGRIHGRGACDTKATFANLLTLLKAEGKEKLKCNLLLAGTVGEETGRLGAGALKRFMQKRGIQLDELMVAEPTESRPVYGHKGGVRMAFAVKGTACHSSKPHLGKNAIVAAADLISAISVEDGKTRGLKRDAWEAFGPLGPPTTTTTLVTGGHGLNIVPHLRGQRGPAGRGRGEVRHGGEGHGRLRAGSADGSSRVCGCGLQPARERERRLPGEPGEALPPGAGQVERFRAGDGDLRDERRAPVRRGSGAGGGCLRPGKHRPGAPGGRVGGALPARDPPPRAPPLALRPGVGKAWAAACGGPGRRAFFKQACGAA